MKSRRIGILSVVTLIVGALALMVFRRSAAGEVVYPIERIVRFFRAPSSEQARMRREIAGLSLVRGDLERLQSENARLRKALGYVERRPKSWIAAEVLSSGGGASATHRSLRVGKGSLDGVRDGAVVVVPEGLVGRVTAVSPHTSVVSVLSDPSIRVSCEVVADATVRVHGILSGGESDRLLIRHLGSAEGLRPQARVVTSGLGGVFPPGLEVGTLLRVTDGVRGMEGEVLPHVDFAALEDVFIRDDQ